MGQLSHVFPFYVGDIAICRVAEAACLEARAIIANYFYLRLESAFAFSSPPPLPPSPPTRPPFSTLLMPIVFCVQFIFVFISSIFSRGLTHLDEDSSARGRLKRAGKSIPYPLSTSKQNPMRSVYVLDGTRILGDNNSDHYRTWYHRKPR